MVSQTFYSVWYLPNENTWRDFNLLAYRDSGVLLIHDGTIEFRGVKGTVLITNTRSVSYGKQGRDFVNNWVKIEYGDTQTPSVAFFADGSVRGWGGIFGGTKKILKAVRRCASCAHPPGNQSS